MVPIAVGDTIPDGNLSFANEQYSFETVSIYSLITGKKALVIGLPGAYMPDCRWCYQPEIVQMAFHRRSIQQTLFITVNDPYVALGWGKGFFPRDKPHVKFLADSKAAYVTSLGLDVDLTSQGFGVRCKRFFMLLEDRKVVQMNEAQIFLDPILSSWERLIPNVSRAPIAVGDIIPDGMLTFINQQSEIEPVSLHSIINGKKVIVLGVRGAFSPRCSKYLVNSFVQKADECKSMGIEDILCISVNDPYAMKGWKRAYFRDDTEINFLADPTAAYVTSLGLVDDLSHTEFGIRSKRFALLLEDRRVKVLEVHRKDLGMHDMLVAGDMLLAMAGAELRAMEI